MSFNRMLLLFLLIVLLLFVIMVALMPVENAGATALTPIVYAYHVYLPIVMQVTPMTSVSIEAFGLDPDGVYRELHGVDLCLSVTDETSGGYFHQCTIYPKWEMFFPKDDVLTIVMYPDEQPLICSMTCSYYHVVPSYPFAAYDSHWYYD